MFIVIKLPFSVLIKISKKYINVSKLCIDITYLI